MSMSMSKNICKSYDICLVRQKKKPKQNCKQKIKQSKLPKPKPKLNQQKSFARKSFCQPKRNMKNFHHFSSITKLTNELKNPIDLAKNILIEWQRHEGAKIIHCYSKSSQKFDKLNEIYARFFVLDKRK